jgi:ribosome maturation factor RimP
MKTIKKQIFEVSQSIIEQNDYFLIDSIFRGDPKNLVIELYVDNKDGVNTVDCAKISREIISQIEEQEIISSKYRLDVSSPGVERPLKYLYQFHKHINRKFSIEYSEENEDLIKKEGVLKKIENSSLLFEFGKEEILINWKNIKTAKVLISF